MLAGVGLLAAMFLLSWFGPSAVIESGFEEAEQIQEQFGGRDVLKPDLEENAWRALGVGRFILLAAALSAIALSFVRSAQTASFTRLRAAALSTALGVAAMAVVLYRLVDTPDDSSREIGAFVGLVAASAVTLTAWFALKDEELRAGRGRGGDRRAPISSPDAPPARGRSATRRRSRSSSD